MERLLLDKDSQLAVAKGLDQYDHDQYLSKETARANLKALEQSQGKVSTSPFAAEKPGRQGMFDDLTRVKKRNDVLYKQTANQACQLLGRSSQPTTLDPLVPAAIDIELLGAVFFKVAVQNKPAPLKIYISRQDDPAAKELKLQVFWSYQNQHPGQGASEANGAFSR